MNEIQRHMNNYWSWLREKTQLKMVRDTVEITTPYLDRHNDYLQIYVVKEDGSYRITDDGYTINDLEDSGCALESQKRQALLKTALDGFGVRHEGEELFVLAKADNFAQKKHNLVQAILAVNDLFYLASPLVAGVFIEIVAGWLDENEIRYSPNVKFSGKSGYDQNFDFLIPKSKREPERLLRAINRPDKSHAQLAILAWEDTKQIRPAGSRSIVLLNDLEREPPAPVVEALHNYRIEPVMWSAREDAREMLVH
uniref:DUF1829 domain-containing protein n=1 Tax=Candidatus Kentrum sp. FM TaxID=2126340 RepID=A0A450THV0_9GAMM|nr:MAG: protein of unknown function DUF1829 [Candidatus Kentron sp. FM]VFJ66779.1 MAG: protein of unknown function DUF1829 [Candidatus Kentron sp. FM]VFK16531.1 MAG: protein of unknown function DUF1829 [Candidatus Kentron sp. FM]